MGVKDLYQWAKSNHKGLIVQCRKRFNDPLIRGKKIAIDATLLTNAFHMRRVGVDEAGKQALIGWYTMIREMRAAGVQPIAVWDQKGTREWKAAEARRRLSIRALALARRNHEDKRKERLAELRGLMTDFQAKPKAEQDALRTYWAEQEWTRYGPAAPDTGPSTPPSTRAETAASPSAPSPPPPASADHTQPFLDKVADLLERHRQSDRPATGRGAPIQGSFDDAVKHIRELEVVSGESAEAGSFDETVPEPGHTGEQPSNLIDEKLQELLPPDEWVETPRQMDLTAMEGKIIESLLGVPPRVVEIEEAIETQERTPPEAVHRATVPVEMAIADLDDLMNRLHDVRHTYARQLALPSSSDHQDCRELLVKLGVPVVTAMIPYEAEGLASALAKKGIVDFVGTEDSDVLAYEGPLLRHVGSSSTSLAYLSGEMVREASGMTSAQFLDFCVLLGTDASPRISKVGPVTAAKLIQQYGSIEKILENEPKIAGRIPDGYMDMVASARAVFAELPPLPDGISMEQGTWDENDVAVWLATEHGIRFVEEAGALSVETVGVVTIPPGPGRWVIEKWDDESRPPDWDSLAHEVVQEMEDEGVDAAGQSDVEEVVNELEEVDLEDHEAAIGAFSSNIWAEVVEAELRRER